MPRCVNDQSTDRSLDRSNLTHGLSGPCYDALMMRTSYENCGACNTTIDTARKDGWMVCDSCGKMICKDCRGRACPLCRTDQVRIFDSGKFKKLQ